MLENIRELDREGYTVFKNFYSEKIAKELVEVKEKLVDEDIGRTEDDADFAARSKSTCLTYMNIESAFSSFASVVQSVQETAELIDDDLKFYFSMMQYSPKGSGRGIGWHQDIDPTSKPFKCNVFNFLIYPQSVTDSSPLVLVPRSHKDQQVLLGRCEKELLDQSLKIVPSIGDLVVINTSLFHYVPNNDDRETDRFSICIRFGPDELKDRLNIGVYPKGRFDYSIGEFV
ncbi:phytanoyl-CoA dioxygenase family protein [Reinekea sp. G2M2-21]|uniref:phytanoyl-CoA dioxygenase family protein n=1 Tax=Reinekea sp. G2M2-21 TaxID=2788942 RepID=UPI0018AA576E|nr:phytanoyl-CoA dioxygenase family protein [Reinekea sp. G2M2-21]